MAILAVTAVAGCNSAAAPSSTATPTQMARDMNLCLLRHGADSVSHTNTGWQAAFPNGGLAAYSVGAAPTTSTQDNFLWSTVGSLAQAAMSTCAGDLQR
jgi:hypothetical protein